MRTPERQTVANVISSTPGEVTRIYRPRVFKGLTGYCTLGLALLCWLATSVPTGSQELAQTDSRMVALFRAAQQDLAAGRYEQAVKEYHQVLQIDPTLIEARVNLGLAYHSLGQYNLAIAELQKVVRKQPGVVGANLFLGIDFLNEKRPGEAVIPLRRVLQAEPSNREARRALATCYLAMDRYVQAAEEFRILASSNPEQADTLYDLGQNYLETAKHLADHLSQTSPDSAWAKRLAGDLQADSARWTEAALNYRQALAADPRQPGLHTSLGEMYLHRGKLALANEEFQADLALDANNLEALLGLAEGQLANSEPLEALESLCRITEIYPSILNQQSDFPIVNLSPEGAAQAVAALRTAPESAGKHFLLSRIYRIAGDAQRSQEQWLSWEKDAMSQSLIGIHFPQEDLPACRSHQYRACAESLLSRAHLDSARQLLLGKALFSLGRYEESASRLANVLSTDKSDLEATYWLARANLKLADGCLSGLMQRFPNSWHAHELMGITEHLRYQDEDAIKEFEAAAAMHPNDPELHQRLGELLYTKQYFARAEEELQKVVALDPGQARSLYLLGRVYLAQHETGQSISYLQAALQRNPNLLEAHAALGQAFMHSEQPELAVRELQKAASIDVYGDLHYLLYVAYHRLGREDLARQALMRSQELRKQTAAQHEALVDKAAEEERR